MYCSVLFTWNKDAAIKLAKQFPSIEFGGTGWDLDTRLPETVEQAALNGYIQAYDNTGASRPLRKSPTTSL